jgi:chitin deacetylase
VNRTHNQIQAAGVNAARLVRPPGGNTNSRVRSALSNAGYRQVMWDVDPWDWSGKSASGIYSNVVRYSRDGSVVVLHDGAANYRNTAAATERIVSTLHSRNYCFGVLDNHGNIVPAVDPAYEEGAVKVEPHYGEGTVKEESRYESAR